jgi:hypothetical protein
MTMSEAVPLVTALSLRADLTGDGCADILGFGDGGVWVSLNSGMARSRAAAGR